MQLDMFGATAATATRDPAPPMVSAEGHWVMPEVLAFDAALQRGALGDAIGVLNRLKASAVELVLMGSGFSIGSWDNRASLIASVQSELVAAAKDRVNGFGLRASQNSMLQSQMQVTPELAAQMQAGMRVVDRDGREYQAFGARHHYLEVHPLDNEGKPIVFAGSSITFHLDSATAGGYPHRRHDPIYLIGDLHVAKSVESAQNVSLDNGVFTDFEKGRENDGRIGQSENVLAGDGGQDRGDGRGGRVDRESLGDGLAGAREGVAGGENLSGISGVASGPGEGRSGERGESSASVAQGDLAGVRDQGISANDGRSARGEVTGADGGMAPVSPASFRFDVPSETWLDEKREDSAAAGRDKYGVPKRMGPITGSFSRSLNLPVDLLAQVPGERGEQSAIRQDSLEFIRNNWDDISKELIYVEVAPDGKAWVSEGNHRIMVAVGKGVAHLSVEVRYFSGGERLDSAFAPNKLIEMDSQILSNATAKRIIDADAVKFVRQGDFWNYSGSRVVEIAKALDLTVTSRNGVKIIGIPEHSRIQMERNLREANISVEFEKLSQQAQAELSVDESAKAFIERAQEKIGEDSAKKAVHLAQKIAVHDGKQSVDTAAIAEAVQYHRGDLEVISKDDLLDTGESVSHNRAVAVGAIEDTGFADLAKSVRNDFVASESKLLHSLFGSGRLVEAVGTYIRRDALEKLKSILDRAKENGVVTDQGLIKAVQQAQAEPSKQIRMVKVGSFLEFYGDPEGVSALLGKPAEATGGVAISAMTNVQKVMAQLQDAGYSVKEVGTRAEAAASETFIAPEIIQAAQGNAKEIPPKNAIYLLDNGSYAKFEDGVWYRGENTPQKAMHTQMISAELKPKDRSENWTLYAEYKIDALGGALSLKKPVKEVNAKQTDAALKNNPDYVLTDADRIGLGGLAEKFQDNIRAIRILKVLDVANRHAVDDERRDLARYVGWGGLKGVFDPDNKQWHRQHLELRALLNDVEWAAASRSQLDAFYTPPVVANAMFSAVGRLGFKHGRVLEPSVGVGNFFGLMPDEMRRNSSLHGVELDVLTSQIVAALYPSATIAKATGFQSYNVPAGYFDMIKGNPPFGNQTVSDNKGSAYSGWSIHNYFFAKSIDMLRPGGIMSMVVSHNFLDKLDPHVRQWIARRAELVSGVRLPKTAFKENANTEVVTDILIFRRLDNENMLGKQELPDWLNTSDVMIKNPKTGDVEAIQVNNYFINNPQNVLGVNSTESSQFRANEYTVLPNGDLDVQLAAWVATLPEGIYVPLERSAVEMELAAVAVPEHVKEGSFYLEGEMVWRRLPDAFGKQRAAAWEAPNQRALERMTGMIQIRDVLRNQMKLERSAGAVETEIEAGRRALNKTYADFKGKYGYLNDPINRRLFLDDTESALLQALEFDYEKALTPAKAEEYGVDVRPARAVQADIFRQRVLFPPVEIGVVETAKDALLHSLNITGRVDLNYMQLAYGVDKEVMIAELGDLLFVDPVQGMVTADEYLSGDVKTKLAEAKKAMDNDPSLSRNVDALTAIIPADKLPSEIHAAIGAAWIPAKIFSDFAKEISGADATFSYIAATAQWLEHTQTAADYAKNSNEYGTEAMGALSILSHTMNSRGLEIKKRVLVDGSERYVTDEEATEAVRQKGDKVRAHWDSWLWSDGDRTDQLTAIYNNRFNRTVERSYDGSHLTFPGMSPMITLLSHQKNGVWRGLQDRVMLMDQVVGAGKTYEGVAMMMEMRRLGITKKPLIAVPNHLTLQWRSDFYRLYPGANVLAATPQDFDKDNRERFFSKIVTGNWDAVIVGHSSLKKIAVPLEAEMKIVGEQFNDMVDAIEELKRERGDRNVIRDMEKVKGNLEAKLVRMREKSGKKDNVVDFADLGVDALFIDEHHEFKNLFFTTQMNRVSGLGNPAGSGKAFDLFVKIRWLQETFGEKAPLITATGTPISNSLAEMFTMQRYMQYSSLKADGLHVFDAWAKQYGDVQNVYEVAPSGTGYRLSQRFAKFKNLPSLMGSYRSFADVITLDDLKAQEIAQGKTFPVPKLAGGRPLNIVAQRSELQEKFFGIPEIVKDEAGEIEFEIDLNLPTAIVQREDGKFEMEQIREGGYRTASKAYDTQEEAAYMTALGAITPRMTIDPDSIVGQFENLRELTRITKGKINALSLTGLANKAGLDYRIIDAAAKDFADSKVNQAVRRMLDTAKVWEADKGVQLVFCDLSVPLSAKAKMANKEKRVYVRDDKGELTHKKGTLHTIKDYEGLPYYLVAVGKGSEKTFSMYDPVTGQLLKDGFDSKLDAHGFVANFVAKDGGQERWLDMRERSRAIEPDEIDDYKNEHTLDADGDAADLEISAQDVEGATGVAGFSIYDDMKTKLVAGGIPANQIEFIHDHDTPQAKDALFKRVNAGDVRFLFGSTPKMGAGTNVQKRLVGLHHIDAPWRPSDLEQREGRIIRRGNMLYERDPEGFTIEVTRYATAQTYDTRRWQLLEHKASGLEQLRNYNGANEIDDVANEASNSADMKAAASGNPLILKETQLTTEVKKLRLLERAHRDGDYLVRSRMNSHRNYAETFGPNAVAELQTLQVQRDSAQVLGLFEGKKLEDKEAVMAAVEKIDIAFTANKAKQNSDEIKKSLVYRGCTFELKGGYFNSASLIFPDDSKAYLDKVSPIGVVTRMENWCVDIEEKLVNCEVRIADSAIEADKLSALLGKPFDQVDDLVAAIAEHGKVQRALMKSNSMAAVRPEEAQAFEAAVGKQKDLLRGMGLGAAVAEIEGEGDEHKGAVNAVPRSLASLVDERRREIESGLGYEFKWRGDTITEGHHDGRPLLENLAIEVTDDLSTLLEDFTDLKGIGEISGKEYASFNDLVLELVGAQYTRNMAAEYSEREGKYLDLVDESAVEMANAVVAVYDYDKVMEEFQKQLNAPGYDSYQAVYSSTEMGKRIEIGRVRDGDAGVGLSVMAESTTPAASVVLVESTAQATSTAPALPGGLEGGLLASVKQLESGLVGVGHIKTRMVEAFPAEIPGGWIVMNAPRPLLGHQMMNGDFVTGRFYAAIDPNDSMAEKYIEENRKLDARVLVVVPKDVQMEMAMAGNEYRDRYMEFDADKRWECLASKRHAFVDMPFGELSKAIAGVSVAQVVPAVPEVMKDVVQEGTYNGKILHIMGGVVVQKVGRDPGEVVKHDVNRLSCKVKSGDVVDIRYREGFGEVTGRGIGVAR